MTDDQESPVEKAMDDIVRDAEILTKVNSQTIEEENQTEPKVRQRKDKKNQTDNVKWSIFTAAETKVAAGKAAKRAGLKLNEWIDRELMAAAQAELTKKSEPPARAEDIVTDIVTKFAQQLQAAQEASTKAQNDLIEKQGQQIQQLTAAVQNQPKSLKEMIFGRSKTD